MKLKKHIRCRIATLLSFSLLTAAVITPSPYASAAKIKLNKTKLKLTVGSTYQLKLKKSKAKIKWTSSKKKVASVSTKGKVKAKKLGTTTITATAKGKKYKCKVTVKKAAPTKPKTTPKTTATKTPVKKPAASTTPGRLPSETPFVIPTPIPDQPAITPEPDATETPNTTKHPDPTENPGPTKEPLELGPLAQNIKLHSALLANNILITVTNQNTVWVDEVTINYDYYDTEKNQIATGYATLYSMQPEETLYITVPINEEIQAIDEIASEIYPDVVETDSETKYRDLHDDITLTSEEFDADRSGLSVDITNHSKYDSDVSYTIFFYDTNHKLVDAYANTFELTAKNTVTETIDFPVDENNPSATLFTEYEIAYAAHGTEIIDPLEPYISKISLKPQKTTHSLLVEVKNNNTVWLRSVNLDYQLYDAEDHFILGEEQSLLSMKPGETQYITINADPETIQNIDFDYTYANITVETDDGEYKYNTTSNVKATVIENPEENDYEITIANNSNFDTEGSYVIYFYDANRTMIAAQHFTYVLMSGDSEIINVAGPESFDENNNPIYAASCTVKIHASHTL